MAQKTWQGDASEVAHVWTGEIGTPTNGHTYIITLTDENGKTHAFTHTVSGSPASTAVVATSFVSEWNASAVKEIRQLTATVDATTNDKVTLTGAAGIPYTIAESGTGTWDSDTTVTTGTGPNDYTNPENWLEGSIPGSSDDVDIPAGSSAILYNLDGRTSTNFNSFTVHEGYTNAIGGTDGAYLEVDMLANKTIKFSGTGTARIEVQGASDTITLYVYNTATPAAGQYGLYLKGESFAAIYVMKGYVACVFVPYGSDFECDAIHVGYTTDQQNDSTVLIGEGAYLLGGAAGIVVSQYGGTVIAEESTGANVIKNGKFIQNKQGCFAANTEFSGNSICEFNAPAGGNIPKFILDDSAQFLNLKDPTAKTMGDVIICKADGVTIQDPNGLITWDASTSIDFAGCNMSKTTLDIGRNKKIVITNS